MFFSVVCLLLVANVVGVVAETVQLPASADSFLERPNGQFGTYPLLIVAKHTGYLKKRAVIKFDTSDAAGKSIVCARVKLWFVYAHRASSQKNEPWVDRKLSVGALLTPWDEMVVNSKFSSKGVEWPKTTQYPDYLSNPEVVEEATETWHRVCENNKSHWGSWDVTAMAREWASGERENNGIIMWATNEDVNGRDLRFASSNYKNKSVLPYLEVAYGDVIDGSKSDCSMFDDTTHTCENPDATTTTASPLPATTKQPTPTPTIKPTPWPQPTVPTLFMSEIIEGSSYNKVIELYNPTDNALQLSDFSIHLLQNQAYDRWLTLPNKALPSGDTYVLCNPSVGVTFASRCDLNSSFLQHNGDDVIFLVLGDRNDFTVIDQFGEPGDLTVWSVCGREKGSINNGVIRKYNVVFGNPNWKESAGTNDDDCEWTIVPGAGNNHLFTGDHDCVLPKQDDKTGMPTPQPTASAKPTVAPTQTPTSSSPTTTPEPIIVGEGEECDGSLPPPYSILCDDALDLVCVHDPTCLLGCAGLCEVATTTPSSQDTSQSSTQQSQSTNSNTNFNTDATSSSSSSSSSTSSPSAASASSSSSPSSSSSLTTPSLLGSTTSMVTYLDENAQCVPGNNQQQCNPMLSLTCVKSFFSFYGTCQKITTPSPTPTPTPSPTPTPTPTPTSSPTSSPASGTVDASTSKASGAMATTVVGVVVGLVVLLLVVVVLVAIVLVRKSKKEKEDSPRDSGPSSFANPLYDEADTTVIAYDNVDDGDNDGSATASGYMDVPATHFDQPLNGYMDVAPSTMDSEEEDV